MHLGNEFHRRIGARSFTLIGEQEQRHAGWKYRSISVKYKAGVTNAASVIRAHRRIRDPQAATTMKIMPYGTPRAEQRERTE
jgi:hypothetical protein